MVETNYFETLSPEELAGLFACFINISIPDDLKVNIPATTSNALNLISSRISVLMNEFYDMELKFIHWFVSCSIWKYINFKKKLVFE